MRLPTETLSLIAAFCLLGLTVATHNSFAQETDKNG